MFVGVIAYGSLYQEFLMRLLVECQSLSGRLDLEEVIDAVGQSAVNVSG